MTARPPLFPAPTADDAGLPATGDSQAPASTHDAPHDAPHDVPHDALHGAAQNAAAARRRLAFADIKQRLQDQPLLNEAIDVRPDRAVGILEQGRFETRFTALLDMQRGIDTAPATSARRTGNTSASGAVLGWRAQSLAFDRTAVLVSSAALFASIGQTSRLVSLDRMTRALHAINFFASDLPGLLFLPVHERLLNSVRHDHGKYFAAVLTALGLDPSRVVIEIPRTCAAQAFFLGYLVRSYRGHGFKVAVDVTGPDDILASSPPDMPDFVIAELAGGADEARIPFWIESLEHAGARDARSTETGALGPAGCRLVVDGIESEAELARLRHHTLRYAFAPVTR